MTTLLLMYVIFGLLLPWQDKKARYILKLGRYEKSEK